MAAKVGHKKFGGRKKGTTNKNITYCVKQRLQELGIDLIQRILDDIAKMDKPVDRAKVHMQLMEYCDAKRKAIEVTDMNQTERDRIKQMSDKELEDAVKLNLQGKV